MHLLTGLRFPREHFSSISHTQGPESCAHGVSGPPTISGDNLPPPNVGRCLVLGTQYVFNKHLLSELARSLPEEQITTTMREEEHHVALEGFSSTGCAGF